MNKLVNILLFVMLLALVITTFTSCTENNRAKNWGGTMTIELKNKKLVNATWKDQDLWYLVKDMKPTDSVETYQLVQDKGGILNLSGNGVVVFKEIKE